MFKLLKKKKARDFIPLLKDLNGNHVNNDTEHQDLVYNFFNKKNYNPPRRGVGIAEARAHIASTSKRTIPKTLKAQLDSLLFVEEIKEVEKIRH